MKILYFEWSSFGNEDIKDAFVELGHELIIMPFSRDYVNADKELEKTITDKLKAENADGSFSSNYYVPIANACHEAGVPYISWVYDSPHVMLYSYTVIYETNHIFVFDREQYEEFAHNNIKTVHYMPLASNPVRLRGLIEDNAQQELFEKSRFYNRASIAFVGAMYDEEHNFFKRLNSISDYTRGYLEGIISVQKQIWSYNIIREMMREDIMDDMSKDLPMQPDKGSVAGRDYLFSEYCINREITARERREYIAEIGKRFAISDGPALDLYTGNEALEIEGIQNHGPIDHYATAPFVYDRAKINLNISLRSIHSGIPLRAFEILGSGGFLLTNYQADFADCFVEGEDFVSFESCSDMLNKIEYYLSHDNERKEIAANGLRKTLNEHTYKNRIKLMLETITDPE